MTLLDGGIVRKIRAPRRKFNSPEERALAKRTYIQEYGREYARTEKRRAAVRRYNQSENGRAKNKTQATLWRARNPEKMAVAYRKHDLKRHYGLTLKEWNAMFDRQGRCCAVCGATEPGRKTGYWCTDHDHKRNGQHARGILCNGCNSALGQVKDSIPRLLALVEYLERTDDAHSAGNELRRPREHTEDAEKGGRIPCQTH